MTLVTANPRRKTRRSNFLFDNLFNELMNTNINEFSKNLTTSRPAVNVIESADDFKIEVAVPGLTKKDIEINIEKNTLTIKAKKEAKELEGKKFVQREFNFNQFNRAFQLPKTIDVTKVGAAFKNGILTITLTKKEEAKEQPPRAIEIK